MPIEIEKVRTHLEKNAAFAERVHDGSHVLSIIVSDFAVELVLDNDRDVLMARTVVARFSPEHGTIIAEQINEINNEILYGSFHFDPETCVLRFTIAIPTIGIKNSQRAVDRTVYRVLSALLNVVGRHGRSLRTLAYVGKRWPLVADLFQNDPDDDSEA